MSWKTLPEIFYPRRENLVLLHRWHRLALTDSCEECHIPEPAKLFHNIRARGSAACNVESSALVIRERPGGGIGVHIRAIDSDSGATSDFVVILVGANSNIDEVPVIR